MAPPVFVWHVTGALRMGTGDADTVLNAFKDIQNSI